MRTRDDLNHFPVLREPIFKVRRIAVIGCAGSGKSTVARQLAEMTGLPLFSLDALYWKPGWVESDKDAFNAEVEALAHQDHWIIEGIYSGSLAPRLARADLVLWFDFSSWFCTYRVLRRTVALHGKVRPEMAPGCPERFDWPFLKYVMEFRRRQRPRLIAAMRAHVRTGTIVPIRNHFALRSFLAAFSTFQAVGFDRDRTENDLAAGCHDLAGS